MSVASMRFSSTNAPTEPVGRERPAYIRRDTDQILSYYQSEDAGKTYYTDDYVLKVAPSPSSQSRSSSPASTYSDSGVDSPKHDVSGSPVSPNIAAPGLPSQRRTSKGSSGGSDKRRVQIVEMDTAVDTNHHDGHGANKDDAFRQEHQRNGNGSPSDLLSRRGRGNLAFVAPPDASPSLYAELTPPLQSAPSALHQQLDREEEEGARTTKATNGHSRSRSEIQTLSSRRARMRKSSRDIGIVGTSVSLSPTQVAQMDLPSHEMTPHLSPDSSLKTDPLLEKAQSLMMEARNMRERESRHPAISKLDVVSDTSNKRERDSVISPVIVGISPEQVWPPHIPSQAPVSATSYSAYAGGQPAVSQAQYVTAAAAPAYLFYQPGVHASAGPLPPPPKSLNGSSVSDASCPPPNPRRLSPSKALSPAPPRPPRLHTPSSSDRQMRNSSSSSSNEPLSGEGAPRRSSERPPRSPKEEVREIENKSPIPGPSHSIERSDDSRRSNHTREGAYTSSPSREPLPLEPPPRISSSSREYDVVNHKGSSSSIISRIRKASSELPLRPEHNSSKHSIVESSLQDGPVDRKNSLTKQRSVIDLRHQSSHSTLRTAGSASPVKYSKALPDPSQQMAISPSDPSPSHLSPSSPLIFQSKRFSRLPKTPSNLSGSHHSHHSEERHRAPTLPKIKSTHPEAMYFGDVTQLKSSVQRAIAYANKINELAGHDAGLEDWVRGMKRQQTKTRTSSDSASLKSPRSPRGPSGHPVVGQRRHASRGSVASEATFPRRPDAYVATDLTPSDTDVIPEGPPPSLPYPGLAQGVRVPPSRTFGGSSSAAPSIHSIPSTPSTNTKSSGGGGFFASIGRKASVKREKSIALSLNSTSTTSHISSKFLMKRPILPPPAPRPVLINASPSLPGGPRAPPSRLARTQSVIAPLKPSTPSIANSRVERHMSASSSSRRSASISGSANRSVLLENSPEFAKQVRKLRDLLPNADPQILTGYLRRTGQDIVAIGQYLEDERRGCLRRD